MRKANDGPVRILLPRWLNRWERDVPSNAPVVFIVDDNIKIREQVCEFLSGFVPQGTKFKQASGLWELDDPLKARAQNPDLRAGTYGIVDLFNAYYVRRIEEIQHNRSLRKSRTWELPKQKIGAFTAQEELLPRVALAAIDRYLRRYHERYGFEPIVFTFMLTALRQAAKDDPQGRNAEYEQWLRYALDKCGLSDNVVDKFEPPSEEVSETDLLKLANRLSAQMMPKASSANPLDSNASEKAGG